MDAPVRLTSNGFWGKRSGYFETSRPKNHKESFGLAFKQKKTGAGNKHSGPSGRRATRWYVGRRKKSA